MLGQEPPDYYAANPGQVPGIGGSPQVAGQYKMWVADPNDPRRLVLVDARDDGTGQLVPVDPRYDPRRSYAGDSGGGGFGVVALLIAAFVVVGMMGRRG